jgi:hypothetical protein
MSLLIISTATSEFSIVLYVDYDDENIISCEVCCHIQYMSIYFLFHNGDD